MANNVIKGAGGKSGGSAHMPTEQPDSLFSGSYIELIEAVCEGEILGLVGGAQGIYLNDTRLKNADGKQTYHVDWDIRVGIQNQSPLPEMTSVSAEQSIATQVFKNNPITATITNAEADYAVVTIGIPRLAYMQTNGDVVGTGIRFKIEQRGNGGAWQPVLWPATVVTDYDYANQRYASPANTVMAEINLKQWYATPIVIRHSSDGINWTVAETVSLSLAMEGWFVGSVRLNFAAGVHYLRFSDVSAVPFSSVTFYQLQDEIVQSGKTMSRFQKQFRFPLLGAAPFDIRVSRITDDSASVQVANDLWFDTLRTEIVARLSYPNTALMYLKLTAKEFGSIPRRRYLMQLLKVRVPVNYDPETRVYTGVWNGSFKVAWTDNPAWCFYDLATNSRYGLGQFISAATIDKWALYQIGQYCDGQVETGFKDESNNPVLEPRFTMNLVINQRQEAYQVLMTLASVFRGMLYVVGGVLSASADMPSDPVFLFNQANVVNGQFVYSGSAQRARHTVALVAWNDPKDLYNAKVEYVEDRDGINRYGINQTEVRAVGCTSRGQAHRLGKWLLYSERLESETISFKAGFDSAFVKPGDIIKVMDSFRSGKRWGGRLLSINEAKTAVTLDGAVTLEAGASYQLSVVLANGDINSRMVLNSAGETAVLTLDSALSDEIVEKALWILAQDNGLQPSLWRVISVSESENSTIAVTALAYQAGKYALVEENLTLEQPKLSTALETSLAAVTNPAITIIAQVGQNKLISNRLNLSWDDNLYAQQYEVNYRRDSSHWQTVTVQANELELPLEQGYFEFEIVAINALGYRSAATTLMQTVTGTASDPFATTFVVDSAAEMLALAGVIKKGDIVKRTDLNKSYVYKG